MSKFASKRNRPDHPTNKLTPAILLRSNMEKSVRDRVTRTQCVGTSKMRLKNYWLKRMRDDGHEVPADNDPLFRYSEIAELARTLGYDTNIKLLDPAVRESCRCSKTPVAGCMVCRFHGGSSKQVIQKGRDRLLEMVDPSMGRLAKIITKGKHEPAVVAAIKDVLDRVGLKKPEDMMPGQGWSEEMIARMADVFDEEELEKFIGLYRKLQAAMPEEEDDAADRAVGVGSTSVKTVVVPPKKMAELIKLSKKPPTIQ